MEQPLFGFCKPKRTKKECGKSYFTDKYLHRIGLYAVSFHPDNVPGYIVERRCVDCGKVFKGQMFRVSNKLENDGL